MSHSKKHRVVIIGGGFGGLYAANHLKDLPVENYAHRQTKFPPVSAVVVSGCHWWAVAGRHRHAAPW